MPWATHLLLAYHLDEILRTAHRIGIVQPLCFALNDFTQLQGSIVAILEEALKEAKAKGDLPPLFEAT